MLLFEVVAIPSLLRPESQEEDFGLDFYCTLMEREGPLFVPRAYYAVQVKSDLDPWVFDSLTPI
jgi:hypothetical protein